MRIATYNVKDLFDPDYAEKTAHLAKELERADADVVALQEVGNEDACHRVLAGMSIGAEYSAFFGSPDRRGIRNVFLHRVPALAKTLHTKASLDFPVLVVGDPQPFGARIPLRRAVPELVVDVPSVGPTSFFCVHFKSRLPEPIRDRHGNELAIDGTLGFAEAELRSLVLRSAEALHVRALVDAALALGHAACVLGDFNDVASSVPIALVRGRGEGALRATTDSIAEDSRYSALHGGRRDQIDHILASATLASAVRRAAIQNEELRDHGPFFKDAPRTEDSDHALVWVET